MPRLSVQKFTWRSSSSYGIPSTGTLCLHREHNQLRAICQGRWFRNLHGEVPPHPASHPQVHSASTENLINKSSKPRLSVQKFTWGSSSSSGFPSTGTLCLHREHNQLRAICQGRWFRNLHGEVPPHPASHPQVLVHSASTENLIN